MSVLVRIAGDKESDTSLNLHVCVACWYCRMIWRASTRRSVCHSGSWFLESAAVSALVLGADADACILLSQQSSGDRLSIRNLVGQKLKANCQPAACRAAPAAAEPSALGGRGMRAIATHA